ncbi:hypothetical protein Taro_049195 [Colocasia esculenta]|uniref:Uncharacterized protein n=1 Tax=Colocasia esculenta TaxID=4460 RepID=A0A843XA91_COLES|nr:hypothetical protein [Colocasia esculenta]
MRLLMEAIMHYHWHKGGVPQCEAGQHALFDSHCQMRLINFRSADWFNDGRLLWGVVGKSYYVAP